MTSKIKNTKRSYLIALGTIALLSTSACSTTGMGSLNSMSLKNPLIPDATEKTVDGSVTGVVDRGLYKAVVAGPGDTMNTLAARAGVTVEQLATQNGVATTYIPKNGQEFAIPGGIALNAVAVSTPTPTPTVDPVPEDEIETTSLGNEDTNSTTHRVKAGETAYSIARLYGVSVTALASWNKLGPELQVSEGQDLVIPKGDTPNATTATQTVSVTPTTTTDATPTTGFQKPVSGSVATSYDPANGSQGIVYSTGSQASVKASSAGKVVLVSESTGANGTIVMVQHPNGLISVYGKLGNASVSKGQEVNAGDSIGTTSGSQLLFQLRKGTASVDPADYV